MTSAPLAKKSAAKKTSSKKAPAAKAPSAKAPSAKAPAAKAPAAKAPAAKAPAIKPPLAKLSVTKPHVAKPPRDEDGVCVRCHKPDAICVCDRIEPITTRTKLLILQHPQEDDVALGTARLLALSLPSATLKVALSVPSLESALDGVLEPSRIDRARWAVLFTSKLPKPLPELAKGQVVVVDRHGDPIRPNALKAGSIDGLVVLDGTWSQAKTLWWRNPWLLKLGRVLVRPSEPSIYGKLRKAPRAEWVSTLEAVAEVLPVLGESPEVRETLRRTLRTMVQRARDAKVKDRTEHDSPGESGEAGGESGTDRDTDSSNDEA